MDAEVVDRIEVGLHQGNVIQLLAQNYGAGSAVIREGVQNAIDEGAENIFVDIDCKKRSMDIFDDGQGAGIEKIREKFDQIGLSTKATQKDAIGEKGTGNLAGLSVSDRWQLVTRDTHVKGDKLKVFTFERQELEKGSGIHLTCEYLPFTGIHGPPFKANTVLKLSGIDKTTLRQMGDKETVESTLREAFNAKLHSKRITLKVSYRSSGGQAKVFFVKPTKYRGLCMDPVEYETEHGYVVFQFFHSPHTVNSPSVIVEHQGVYSLPLKNFFLLRILPKEIEHLFLSGYFEGEIRLGFCEINGSRSAFTHNSELQAFIKTVEAFADEVLRPMIEQFELADREERLRRVAEGVLRKIRSFLNKHPNLLPTSLKSVILRQEQEEEPDVDGEGGRSKKTGQEKHPKKRGERKPLDPNALERQRDKSRAIKAGVVTPKRKKTIVETTEGLAIQLIHPDAEDGFNWRSRTTTKGVIQINIVSSEFLETERRGQTELSRLMLLLVQKELTCASLPIGECEAFDRAFEGTFLSLWRSSLQG
jgi:hypothetical protein|tara:strand:+ start:1114 stop:2712 length:1599 start_codon:yes stop_codon:yes gene_type:complete